METNFFFAFDSNFILAKVGGGNTYSEYHHFRLGIGSKAQLWLPVILSNFSKLNVIYHSGFSFGGFNCNFLLCLNKFLWISRSPIKLFLFLPACLNVAAQMRRQRVGWQKAIFKEFPKCEEPSFSFAFSSIDEFLRNPIFGISVFASIELFSWRFKFDKIFVY